MYKEKILNGIGECKVKCKTGSADLIYSKVSAKYSL